MIIEKLQETNGNTKTCFWYGSLWCKICMSGQTGMFCNGSIYLERNTIETNFSRVTLFRSFA